MSSEVHASGAVLPYPQIMPYVPPSTAQMYDILFNSYGVTAIDESNENKKLAAYVDLVTRVMGAGAESFKEELQNMIVQATQTRKVIISESMGQSMIDILNEAITNGVNIETETGGGYVYPPYEVYSEYLAEHFGKSISLAQYNQMRAIWEQNQNYGVYEYTNNNALAVWLYSEMKTGVPINRPIFKAPAYSFIVYANGETYTWNIETGETSNQIVNTTKYYKIYANYQEYINTMAYEGRYRNEKMQTKDSTTTASIQAGTATIATPFSVVDTQTGLIDDTKPVVIQLPTTLPIPATTTQELAETQEQLGVKNVDTQEDVADIVEGLQTAYEEQYGDVSEYGLNLTELFPFCIPFDIGRILTMFVAEPEAPHFQFIMPVGYTAEDGVIFDEFEIDLSDFDIVAYWCRKGMLLVFIVGLGMITREKILRG